MVVDVATALMYGAQGHSSLFPMFGFDTMSTLGKNCTHFLSDIGFACNGTIVGQMGCKPLYHRGQQRLWPWLCDST